MSARELKQIISETAEKTGFKRFAVAYEDFETGETFAHDGDRLLHAASTFKAAVLLALLREAERDRLKLNDHLQVRNRFVSIADGKPFRIERERDGDEQVHRQVGRSMELQRLAHAMITRSSNLATNLLLDFLGPDRINEALKVAGVDGIIVRRGVEDIAAHDQGVNNEASAAGLASLFRAFWEGNFLSAKLRGIGLDILLAQEFKSMLPAKLPREVKVAHKTGEISTHIHDAGLVFPPNREPYAVAIMTESDPATEGRQAAVAQISKAIFQHLTGGRA